MATLRVNSKLFEQAALWVMRLEQGELMPAERRRYERWLTLPDRAKAMQLTVRFIGWLDKQLAGKVTP